MSQLQESPVEFAFGAVLAFLAGGALVEIASIETGVDADFMRLFGWALWVGGGVTFLIAGCVALAQKFR